MLTTNCLNAKLANLQCKNANMGAKVSNALSVGHPMLPCLRRDFVTVNHILQIGMCYKAFSAPVTYATKITFNKIGTDNTTVTLAIGATTYTPYTGTGDSISIATFFKDVLDAAIVGIDYEVERVGNVLYIYSYDSSASFSDITTVVSSNTSVTSDIVNIQNNLEEILNLWNCLTEQELCEVITFAQCLETDDCGC